VVPQIEWDYESGASAGNAKNLGAVIGVTKVFSPTLVLGLGAGVFRQIDETKVFPFIIINWQIDDKWRLSNPLPAGPAGGGTFREYRYEGTVRQDDGGRMKMHAGRAGIRAILKTTGLWPGRGTG
jgi:hypothetical protein